MEIPLASGPGASKETTKLFGSIKRLCGWLAALQAVSWPFDLDKVVHDFVLHNVVLTACVMVSYFCLDLAFWGLHKADLDAEQRAAVRALSRARSQGVSGR